MDALRDDDIARARATPYSERAAQAFEAMRFGIRLKRAALRTRHPDATEDEIEAKLQKWLARDE